MNKKYYKSTNGSIIEMKEWNGRRVLTTKDITKIHGFCHATIPSRLRTNKDVLEENIDYYQLKGKDAVNFNGTAHVTIYTKSGYELIVGEKEKEERSKTLSEYYNGNDFYFSKEKKSDKINVSRETNVQKEEEKENENNVEQEKAEQITVESLETENMESETPVENQPQMFESLLEITKMALANQSKTMEILQKQADLIDRLLKGERVTMDNPEETGIGEESEIPDRVIETKIAECKAMAEEEEFPSYIEWKRRIEHACKLVIAISKKYMTTSKVLHDSYEIMKNRYGICWAQEKREYPGDGRKRSTLEVAYAVEYKNSNCRYLLQSIIKDIYEREKATA